MLLYLILAVILTGKHRKIDSATHCTTQQLPPSLGFVGHVELSQGTTVTSQKSFLGLLFLHFRLL